jgi:hypothetical protein
MKKLLFFASVALIISACSNSGNKTQSVEPAIKNEIVITNDMENAMAVIPSWYNENTVIAMNEPAAHSGSFSGITNDTLPYGYTYKETLKNLDSRVPKMATVSGWIYTTAANVDFSIICGISEKEQTYNWKAYPLYNILGETGKWIEFTTSFYFDDKPLNPEQAISFYGWNKSKNSVYTDDLKITIIY